MIDQKSLPSVKASLNPSVGIKDAGNILTDKERDEEALMTRTPKAPPLPPPPQPGKAPSTTPLRRRNAGGIAVPRGSTMLSGPSGVANAQMSLGGQTLMGGGG